MQKLVIYGLTNPLVFKLIDAMNRRAPVFSIQGIVLSPGDSPGADRYGHPFLGESSVLAGLGERDELYFFCNVNRSPREMKEADEVLARNGCRTVDLVHPDIDMNYVKTGGNVCLAEGCLMGPGVILGHHVTCRLGGIVSHEVVIEDRVYLSPGVKVCGAARLLEGCDIGAGATILPKRTVGRNTIVGAGAVVTHDLPDQVTAVGVPARIISTHSPDDSRFYGIP
jgi:acetyltransferase-like isoleucine patch superfamily enzyme